jgi:hypothetical protein
MGRLDEMGNYRKEEGAKHITETGNGTSVIPFVAAIGPGVCHLFTYTLTGHVWGSGLFGPSSELSETRSKGIKCCKHHRHCSWQVDTVDE